MLAEPNLQGSAEGLFEGLPVEAVRAGKAKELTAFAHFRVYSEVDEAELATLPSLAHVGCSK
jgi:hypothetical protein